MTRSSQKILVTGGAGFIGSHVVDAYIKEGYEVVVIDNLVTGKKENSNPKAILIEADITNAKAVEDVFSRYGPFTLLNHMAAQKSVTDSVKDPIFDANTNIIGALTLFEAARHHGVKQIVFSSTGGALYGEEKTLPIPETAQIRPGSSGWLGRRGEAS